VHRGAKEGGGGGGACGLFQSAYLCVVCDSHQEQHTTRYESEAERVAAGRPTGAAFFPLAHTPQLQRLVLRECAAAAAGSAAVSTQTETKPRAARGCRGSMSTGQAGVPTRPAGLSLTSHPGGATSCTRKAHTLPTAAKHKAGRRKAACTTTTDGPSAETDETPERLLTRGAIDVREYHRLIREEPARVLLLQQPPTATAPPGPSSYRPRAAVAAAAERSVQLMHPSAGGRCVARLDHTVRRSSLDLRCAHRAVNLNVVVRVGVVCASRS